MPINLDKLRAEIADAIENVCGKVIDEYILKYLEDRDCWLEIQDDGISVLIGIGPGDAAQSFEPTLVFDAYGHLGGPRSQAQQDDVLHRIEHLKGFIAELQAAQRELEAQAQAFEKKRTKLVRISE